MKYPYKTKIAEHDKILITFVDFESAKVAKLDFGKTSAPELASFEVTPAQDASLIE